MNSVLVKAVLFGVLLSGIALIVRVAAWPIVRVSPPPRAEARAPEPPRALLVGWDSLAQATVARDPFRLARRPSPVAYYPMRVGQPLAPPAPKPTLVVVGIVWDGGQDPTALLEGLPGVEGPRVVRSGETVGELRVKRIERERVLVVGLDTVWVLRVRETWR